MARICGNPRSASGSVPGPGARSDVAAIGFSDNGYGALTCPALTTVHIEAEAAGSLYLRRARVNADDVASHGGKLQRERAVAASEVEDALACARGEQLDHRRTEVGDEAGVARVCVGVPALGGSWHVLNYS